MVMLDLELRVVGYDHPDAAKLIAEVQQEYVVRYGDEDITPVDPAEFAPPLGLFIVGYLGGEAVVCGGWRAHDSDDPQFLDGDAEIKRMYVVNTARGKGLAKRMLAELERTAREAGRLRMVLETGTKQPEAVALYGANGYERIPNFGAYKDHPLSLCFAKSLS
ncbi:Ribosomal protein S18 acetylase RimI [Allokutzneria albata]|uniref:Ribosomal protein S18 acetylase RimI n=2 Tax=Allokutzneria albata TaxID=211114 RepID=A0A1G9XHN5_ALLAB|nr:Ribosomal protein S18 acetylase RimI [Allokutzneria albata]